jgi:acid phosphatase (class A)
MVIRSPRFLLAIPLLLVTAGFAGAKDKAAKMDKAEALHYLTPASVDVMKLLPAPPKPETDEAKADLDVVLRVQEKRTDAEVARALSEAKLKMKAFSPVVGTWFTAENLPLTAKLIKTAEKDSKYFSALGKEKFARKRPPNDARIKPKIEESDEPSYPSGHSTRAILFASIIAELDPEQADLLMDRAREIGWDRVIAGVHYPSDIIAGRVLGQALFQAMGKNPEFQADLAVAKAEFAAAQQKFAAIK